MLLSKPSASPLIGQLLPQHRAAFSPKPTCPFRPPGSAFRGGADQARMGRPVELTTQTGHRHSRDRQSPPGDHAAVGTRGGAMDLGGWLRQLGLEHYEAAFRENKIDDTVLPSLTAEDLKDLGVGFVGDRRKLLDAIAALRTGASAQPLATDVAKHTAERRQVTVMFSDLVGSTALSARMDPEDLREVISAYRRCVADTVCRLGGFVAKYMG